MFDAKVYQKRRELLRRKLGDGLILFLGDKETPINFKGNPHRFRQDSTFLYYYGLDIPDLAAIIDCEEEREIIFGNNLILDEIIWTGSQPSIKQHALKCGVKSTAALGVLEEFCTRAIKQGRNIHFIPQYRDDNILAIHKLLGIAPKCLNDHSSSQLARIIIEQRSVKSKSEVAEIESAINLTKEMQIAAMRYARPGMAEREVTGFIEGLATSLGGGVSYPVIFSNHGEILHNHSLTNKLKAGDLAVNDCGSESVLHYASDITRTFPVSGKFTSRQKDIYEIVLDANLEGIASIKAGVSFKDVHLKVCSVIAEGLKSFGIMKGNMKEAVAVGAHALFFPHGLGHLLGLDSHDMENLGEDHIGYDTNTKRSSQFGLKYLRFAKSLADGMVITVEPGVYFIPPLIDKWQSENKFGEFIDYNKVNMNRSFGGIRIEDDVIVTSKGSRVLGNPIPKTTLEVEDIASDKI